MLPFKGVYLLLILAGTPETPERIGLEQQLDMKRCAEKAQQAADQHKYAVIQCIWDGAIVSPALEDFE